MPGLPVHDQLLELAQIHVHWVGDAIQPSHPLSSPSPPTFNLSQHQGLFQWVSSSPSGGQSIGVSASASVLPMNSQNWSPLGWTGWISLLTRGFSRVFSNTTVQKHQFFGVQLSLIVQLSHPYMTTGKTIALTRWTFVGKVMSMLFNTLSRLVSFSSKEQVSTADQIHLCTYHSVNLYFQWKHYKNLLCLVIKYCQTFQLMKM